MNPAAEEAHRDAIIARLAQSRAEIQALLDPPPEAREQEIGEALGLDGEFPRSRLLRALISGRGIGTLGALAGGLLVARPGLIWKLVRSLPMRAVARMLVLRAVAALRERHAARPG